MAVVPRSAGILKAGTCPECMLGRRVVRHSPARLSKRKAREMLHHGEVHGESLTKKQRGYFGAVASGTARKKGR